MTAVFFVALLLGSVCTPGSAAAQATPQSSLQTASHFVQQPAKGSGSLLHDFLGIDPQTGQFRPAEQQNSQQQNSQQQNSQQQNSQQQNSQQQNSQQQNSERSNADGQPATNAGQSSAPARIQDVTIDNLPQTAEEASAAFRRATEQLGNGSLDDLAALLNGSSASNSLVVMHRNLVWVSTLLMLVYPLGIVLAEFVQRMSTKHQTKATNLDRRYERTRFRRRMILAGVWTGLILAFGFGTAYGYWWNQPLWLGLFAVVTMVLSTAAIWLTTMIRQAASQHTLGMLREMYLEQLELRADLNDLRKLLEPQHVDSDYSRTPLSESRDGHTR